MKKIVFLLSVLTIGALSFSSCKKCYDCSREVTNTIDGVKVAGTDSVNVCGNKDRNAYEDVGYQCGTNQE